MIPFKQGTQTSQNHKDRKYNGGCHWLGERENGNQSLMGIEFQFHKMKSVMGMGGSDGCTTM